MVYADEKKIEESLIDDIIEPTENEFAIRAFISTFTSPKASKMSYDEMLETIRDRNESLRVGLVYGREDPWVVPLWGQRLKRVIKNATYYELSPVGHCPNDEAPEAVNLVIERIAKESLEEPGRRPGIGEEEDNERKGEARAGLLQLTVSTKDVAASGEQAYCKANGACLRDERAIEVVRHHASKGDQFKEVEIEQVENLKVGGRGYSRTNHEGSMRSQRRA